MDTIHVVALSSMISGALRSFHIFHLAVVIFSLILLYEYCYNQDTLPLPPGPIPLPIIGNLHQFNGNPLEIIRKWHQKYGPLISIRAGQRTVIIISSYEIASDLLDKRSAVYSSRPDFHVASKHLSRHMFIPSMPYNRQWMTHRRAIVSLLNPTMTKRYQYVQDIESKQAIHELLTSHDFSLIFERYVTSLQFTLAYGIRLENVNRPEISEMRYIVHCLIDGLESNIGMGVIELFPFLDRLPRFLAPWNKFWEERYNRTIKFYLENLEYARTKQKSSWTWAHEATRAQQRVRETSDAEIAYMIGTMNVGGIESTPKILRTSIKALLVNPAAVKRAQQEIDEVVGCDRLPEFEDRSQMPYTNALIKEVLRWQTLLPLSMPHSTATDEEYMGYRIPKGSIIVPNHDEMANDSNKCPDPQEFKPERWLGNCDLQVFSPFGYGRRKCPGEYMAMNSLFIVISRILWGYNINHAVRGGRIVEVGTWDIENHFTSSPAPFEVSFEVRDEHRRRIIEREFCSMEIDVSRILQKVAP